MQEMGAEIQLISTRRPDVQSCRHPQVLALAPQTRYLYPFRLGELARGILTRPRGLVRALGLCRQVSDSPKTALRQFAALLSGLGLAEHAKKQGIRHVHVHSCGYAALIAAYSRRMGGPTYSLTLHNPLSTFGPHQVEKWRDAEFGIVITRVLLEAVKAELGVSLPSRMMVAPMGVDPAQFVRPPAEPYVPWSGEGPYLIFSCARLNPGKRHEDTIRMVGILRGQGQNVRLSIAGSEDVPGYRVRLESLVRELGLVESVVFLGALSDKEIIDQLKAAHAFVLLAAAEPLGVAYMEAMSMEVPVVGTNAGGVPELIKDGQSGLLVRPAHPEDAAEAVLRLIRDGQAARSMGADGRRTVVERFSSVVSARVLFDGVSQTLSAAPA